jgi:hypothetical protein
MFMKVIGVVIVIGSIGACLFMIVVLAAIDQVESGNSS